MSDGKKTLLPELLPTPRPASGRTPRARVDDRARSMLDRFATLKTAAGAAVVAAQIGCYTTVDPLPPPSSQCTDLSDPYSGLGATAKFIANDGIEISLGVPRELGINIAAVRVTGGRLLEIINGSREGSYGDTEFRVRVWPDAVDADAGLAPDAGVGTVTVEVDFVCGTVTTTKQFTVMGPPGFMGGLSIVEL